MVNSKHALWMALVFTIIIFIIGVALGFFLEQSRANQFSSDVTKSEVNLLDEQIMNKAITDGSISCGVAINSTFSFADRIYAEAATLENYDSASEFTSDLREIHMRYDLLRMLLWNEATGLKQNCNASFHTVVYLFDYQTTDTSLLAEQDTMSKLLLDMKQKYPNQILLIPIAANLNLESVNLVLQSYKIQKEPVIIIDNNQTIDHLVGFNELENDVFNSNKE